MDQDFLEACASLTTAVSRFYPLIKVTSVLAGFCLIGTALLSLRRRSETNRSILPALACLVIGTLMACFTGFVDALSLAVFQESAPADLSSVSVGSAGGLENMVVLALVIVMTVGAYQIVKGMILLKEASDGSRTFWPGIAHVAGGVLCLNMKSFLLALGTTFGGSVEEVITTLLGA